MRLSCKPNHLNLVSPVHLPSARRRSSFSLKKLAPAKPVPVEGTYKLIGCGNYEKFLQAVGTGPLSLNMVMRASVVMSITQVGEVVVIAVAVEPLSINSCR